MTSYGVHKPVDGVKGSRVVGLCGGQFLDGLTQFTYVIAPVSSSSLQAVLGHNSAWVFPFLLLMMMTMTREIVRRYDD